MSPAETCWAMGARDAEVQPSAAAHDSAHPADSRSRAAGAGPALDSPDAPTPKCRKGQLGPRRRAIARTRVLALKPLVNSVCKWRWNERRVHPLRQPQRPEPIFVSWPRNTAMTRAQTAISSRGAVGVIGRLRVARCRTTRRRSEKFYDGL